MAEDCGTVEGAIILREVQPALETVRAFTTDTNANDVGRAATTYIALRKLLYHKDALSSAQTVNNIQLNIKHAEHLV